MKKGLNGWMMNQLFNSVPEMELRIEFLLNQFADVLLSSERIVAFDFICIYGKEFEIAEANLHGNSPYKFGEIASKRQLVNQALKAGVLHGLIDVDLKDGYRYRISKRGKVFVDSFESKYGKQYSDNAKAARRKYSGYDENGLMKMIRSHCKDSLEGRG